ncbi:2,3-diaminopropionate biosynthesis protein SbnA [Aureliella helgolandensis]|uniref:N-(2-amino-2-carboxyethyl)-L-glutamate synthase n=1 Tax=Aureliella helgolandensis TaxID=2527968 RepID=A0A518G4T4_9BACT|nr:2,3-diaminopropionate biosynthesis protein SbnA [Aureliella helgolandensis]QDV23617.1 putative siderophore biosynthesis protein SbnA [Aureliella helgolandensis]
MMIIPPSLPDAPVAEGILNTVGHTPLVRFGRFLDEPSVELFAKLEAMNPGGSAKDRPALQMLNHAIAAGEIDESTTIVESSSGNMGIGLAQACRYYGLQLICVVDPHAQPQNIAIMRALGAQIEQVSEPFGGSYLSARLMRVRQLLHSTPASFWPNQYANLQNPQAHFEGTIREIDEALNGDFDFLFVATSSTGTARGCRDYLRSKGRNVKVVAVDAEGSVLFGGKLGERLIPGLGAGRKPRLAKDQTFDEVRRVSDFDCVVGCRRAADREAVLVGGSAGGVLEVVRSMQSELMGRRCVAILHDSGARYMDTVYNDDWVQSKLGVAPEQLAARVSMHGDMLQAM